MTGYIGAPRRLCALLLLTLAACGGEGGPPPPPPPDAQISTLAYVVTECQQPAGAAVATFQQALWIRQGEQEPIVEQQHH